MKKRLLYFFALTLITIAGCSKDSDNLAGSSADTEKPVVTILYPPNQSELKSDTVYTIKIDASDNKSVAKVELFIDGSSVLTITAVPYEYKWNTAGQIGDHSVYAKATDGNGNTGQSAVITVKVILNNTPPMTPVLISPLDGADSVTSPVTFIWDSVGRATGYILQLSTISNFSTYIFNENLGKLTSKQIIGLYNNATYYWRVSAVNNYGSSAPSSVRSFKTPGASLCPGIPIVTYEGKTYNTVQIGTQCWLKENLNVGTRVNGSQNQSDNSTIEKYCYNDDEANCYTYGGLYQWNEAMQYSTMPGTRGICPPGWHIPTNAEFEALAAAVNNDGNALKVIGQGIGSGQGTNTSGFSALLAGYRNLNGSFASLGYYAYFWSSTENSSSGARFVYLYYAYAGIGFYGYDKEYGFSVRCVKDSN